MISARRFFAAACALACAAAVVPVGEAVALDLRQLDARLATLPFGKDVNAVSAWVATRIEREWAPKIARAVEDVERNKLAAQRDREVFDFRSSEVAFDGRRTGLEVSLVSGEFMVGSGESLLKLIDNEGTHYFFMINGKLWKYARSLRPTEPFPARVAATTQLFGPAEKTELRQRFMKDAEIAKAIWSDTTKRARLWNRRTLYGADLLIIEHRPIADRIAELRGGRDAATTAAGVDPDLAEFLIDDGADEEEELIKEGGSTLSVPAPK